MDPEPEPLAPPDPDQTLVEISVEKSVKMSKCENFVVKLIPE